MLTEKGGGSVVGSDDDGDLFSLITEDNLSKENIIQNEQNRSTSSASSINADDSKGGFKGTLILDGDEQTNSKRSDHVSSDEEEKFTVPESVFLPSEIGTLEEQSNVSNGKENVGVEKNDSESASHNTDNEQKYRYYFPPNALAGKQLFAHAAATFVVIVGMLTLSAWRCHVWRKEALHLKKVLHLQAQEHSSLNLKIASLEADLADWNRRHKDPHNWKFEKGHWEIDDEDDNIVVSFKNCYLEASIALGRCSKEWQEWFFGENEEIKESYSSHDDGFTDDMEKLVDWVADGVVAASSRSATFFERTLKHMSSFYYIGDEFGSTDAKQTNETLSEIGRVFSSAMKVAESVVDDTTFLI